MSKFLAIAGIVAAAAGVALGLMAYLTPGQMQAVGVTLEVAAILLIGGLGLIGIGGVITAIEQPGRELHNWTAGHEHDAHDDFAPAAAAAGVAAATMERAADTAKEAISVVKTSTADTIAALDKAKDDISKALGVTADTPVEAPPPVVAPEPEEAPDDKETTEEKEDEEPPAAEAETAPVAVDEDQLFVVDEKVIRGRPARVLSDGTVEAETDEGWMRFENLEHLEEYLDAVAPPAAKA
jgi:hypothetical protein